MSTKVWIDCPSWFYRRHSTDFLYARRILPQIQGLTGECSFVLDESFRAGLLSNLSTLNRSLRERTFGPERARTWHRALSARDVSRIDVSADLVYSNRAFPVNSRVPVVWQETLVDPDMRLARGDSREYIQREASEKLPLFRKAARIIVSTSAECKRLESLAPDLSAKISTIPFYMPALADAPDSLRTLERHGKLTTGETIRVLFIGNDARRKQLPRVLTAFERLRSLISKRTSLTVVSNFTDGVVDIPDDIDIECVGGLTHAAVLALLRDCHILVAPSAFESFGFVLVEAMSMGCVPVAPNWEAQREIVANGCAGVCVDQSVDDLVQALVVLVEHDEFRVRLAERGLARFRRVYAPEVTGPMFLEAFSKAART